LNFEAYIQEQQWQQADEAAFTADAARAAEQLADYATELGEITSAIGDYAALTDDEKTQYRTDNELTAEDATYYLDRAGELAGFVTAGEADKLASETAKAAKAAEKATADAARLAAAVLEKVAVENAARDQGVKDRRREKEVADNKIRDANTLMTTLETDAAEITAAFLTAET